MDLSRFFELDVLKPLKALKNHLSWPYVDVIALSKYIENTNIIDCKGQNYYYTVTILYVQEASEGETTIPFPFLCRLDEN